MTLLLLETREDQSLPLTIKNSYK